MLKVIVVEDEELIRNEIVLTTPWEKFSCEIIGSAENGLIGEELINRLNPDIVITDMRMPGKNGIEMLKSTNVKTAIVLTGYSDFNLMQSAIRVGVKEYILKPVDDNEFYAALDRISKDLLLENSIKRKQISSTQSFKTSPFKEYIAPPNGDKQDYYINKVIEYIATNFKEDISLNNAAEHVNITGSYLSRLFKTKTSYSFLEYLRMYRIKTALSLMNEQDCLISEVARNTGFNDMSYFSSVFRKYIGISPSTYINGLKIK